MSTNDLEGRVYVVTGASSGVGLAAVRGLVARGAHVIGASRSGARGEASEGLALDLTDPEAILRATDEVRRARTALDGLVHAAGGIYFEPQISRFGVDRTWAVDYLGHVLLTRGLWSLLANAPRARIATVAGNPRFVRPAGFDPTALERAPTSGLAGAVLAMAMRVLWTHSLSRRCEGTRITALAFHPGLVRSNLVGNGPWIVRTSARLLNAWASPHCAIAVRCATDASLDRDSGSLIDPSGKAHRFPALEAHEATLTQISDRLIERAAPA